MSGELYHNVSYKDWLKEIKERIRTSRGKAALAANAELIVLYWDLGKIINEKSNNSRIFTKRHNSSYWYFGLSAYKAFSGRV